MKVINGTGDYSSEVAVTQRVALYCTTMMVVTWIISMFVTLCVITSIIWCLNNCAKPSIQTRQLKSTESMDDVSSNLGTCPSDSYCDCIECGGRDKCSVASDQWSQMNDNLASEWRPPISEGTGRQDDTIGRTEELPNS